MKVETLRWIIEHPKEVKICDACGELNHKARKHCVFCGGEIFNNDKVVDWVTKEVDYWRDEVTGISYLDYPYAL